MWPAFGRSSKICPPHSHLGPECGRVTTALRLGSDAAARTGSLCARQRPVTPAAFDGI